jgi:hypothetical protein
MINKVELDLQKLSEERISLADKLNQAAIARIAEREKLAAEEKIDKEDPAEAVLKAYISMDKEMMKVMDEHIERVRRSNERNKELFRKLAIKKDIEKRARMRKEYFDEAAEKVEEQRKLDQLNLFRIRRNCPPPILFHS